MHVSITQPISLKKITFHKSNFASKTCIANTFIQILIANQTAAANAAISAKELRSAAL